MSWVAREEPEVGPEPPQGWVLRGTPAASRKVACAPLPTLPAGGEGQRPGPSLPSPRAGRDKPYQWFQPESVQTMTSGSPANIWPKNSWILGSDANFCACSALCQVSMPRNACGSWGDR